MSLITNAGPLLKENWPVAWSRRRKLVQYKTLTDEEFVSRMREADERKSGKGPDYTVDPAKVKNLELTLAPALRQHYRREVQRVLDEIGESGNTELLRPIVELLVFVVLMARTASIQMYEHNYYGDKDVKALDLLLSRAMQMLGELEQTPKGLRLSQRKTQETISEALEASRRNVEAVRSQKAQHTEEEAALRAGPKSDGEG